MEAAPCCVLCLLLKGSKELLLMCECVCVCVCVGGCGEGICRQTDRQTHTHTHIHTTMGLLMSDPALFSVSQRKGSP